MEKGVWRGGAQGLGVGSGVFALAGGDQVPAAWPLHL